MQAQVLGGELQHPSPWGRLQACTALHLSKKQEVAHDLLEHEASLSFLEVASGQNDLWGPNPNPSRPLCPTSDLSATLHTYFVFTFFGCLHFMYLNQSILFLLATKNLTLRSLQVKNILVHLNLFLCAVYNLTYFLIKK